MEIIWYYKHKMDVLIMWDVYKGNDNYIKKYILLHIVIQSLYIQKQKLREFVYNEFEEKNSNFD